MFIRSQSVGIPRALVLVTLASLVGCGGTKDPSTAPSIARSVDPGLAARTIFQDDFDFAKSEWQQYAGIWELNGGYLSQMSDDPRQLNAIKYVQTPRVADATIETLVRVTPFRPSQWTNSRADEDLKRNIRFILGAGIVFRMQDVRNFYMFRLAGEEGAVLGRMIDGEWNAQDLCNPRVRDFLRGERIQFSKDNWYRLKVEARGSRLTTYVNDEPVCSVVDDTFGLGQVGLVTFKVAADFDWVRVSN